MEARFWDLRWSHTDGTHLYLYVIDIDGYTHKFDIYRRVLYETDRYRITQKFFSYIYDSLRNAEFYIDPETGVISWDREL